MNRFSEEVYEWRANSSHLLNQSESLHGLISAFRGGGRLDSMWVREV